MEIKPLRLKGTFEIISRRNGDSRGYFMRTYDRRIFADLGLQPVWEQESQSFNIRRDTIRGLHFQKPPLVETKFVSVLQGAIWDVFVDLRKDSETYGQWDSIELTAENDRAVYIPKGFAHGFRTLAENTLIAYKIDVLYQAELAGGIRWNDPSLNVNWQTQTPIISPRDEQLEFLENFISPF